MIRPHTPPDPPDDKAARRGLGGSGWASPWGLDHEWQDAPAAKKARIVFGEEPVRVPPPQPVEPPVEPPVVRPEMPVQEPQPPRRAPLSRPVLSKPNYSRNENEASWSTLIILSMGMLAFVFIAWVYVEDDKNVGADEDLLVRWPLEQAVTIRTPDKVRKFLDSLVSFENPELYGQPPWQWDTPTLSRIVQSNGAALDNLRDLLEDADWHPHHAAWHAEDLGGDPRWHQALLLKQVEAAYLSRKQLEEEAFTAAIDLAETGWRLEQVQAWPSFYQRSLEAQTRAAQTLGDLLRQTRLPEATLRQFQRQYSVCQPTNEMLAAAQGAFYVHEKKLILGPKSGENLDTMPGGAQLQRPGRLFFKPYETVRLFATAFRQLQDDSKTPLAHTSEIRLKGIPPGEGSWQPNSAGLAYFTRRMKLYTPLPAFVGLVRARGSLVITLFAVRRCIAERKTLPTNLEQLRDYHYLLDVPPDVYTGAALQYDAALGLIWSVGNDLQSRGGAVSDPPMNDATEPTIETGITMATPVKSAP